MSQDLMKARIMMVMKNLPPLPAVTRQLLAVMRDENASADDVTKVLSGDQALAGKVLKLVNSSFYGVSSEVTTISRAVVILGFTGVRNLALGFGSVEALQKMGGNLDMNAFWSHAMANAAAAQCLAPAVSRRTDPEEAFIAGLMHDIGAYVLAAAVPEQYAAILNADVGERLSREKEELGFTHSEVGAGLLKFWELPDAFANAAHYHHNMAKSTDPENPLTGLVALADVLACIHGGAFEAPIAEADLGRLMSAIGVGIEDVKMALRGMGKKIDDMKTFMSIAGAGGAGGNRKNLKNHTCVVVTSDEGRRDWVECLIEHFGHKLFPQQPWFNQEDGCQDVSLALIDPQCLTSQQVEQLVPFLESQTAKVIMLADDPGQLPDQVKGFPAISFIFSPEQIQSVTEPVTVGS